MTKRVHYPVNKEKIAEAIHWYKAYNDGLVQWDKYYDACLEICPRTHTRTTIYSLIQAMDFADTLTVDNVYYAIIASGVNTRLEEVDYA